MHHHHEEICKKTKDTHEAKEYFLKQLAFTMGPDRLKHLMEDHLHILSRQKACILQDGLPSNVSIGQAPL